jgi:hypothetical protein
MKRRDATIVVAVLWCATAFEACGYYNPSTGRWLSRDPIEENGGIHIHAFANNSPVTRYDGLGLREPGAGAISIPEQPPVARPPKFPSPPKVIRIPSPQVCIGVGVGIGGVCVAAPIGYLGLCTFGDPCSNSPVKYPASGPRNSAPTRIRCNPSPQCEFYKAWCEWGTCPNSVAIITGKGSRYTCIIPGRLNMWKLVCAGPDLVWCLSEAMGIMNAGCAASNYGLFVIGCNHAARCLNSGGKNRLIPPTIGPKIPRIPWP